MEDGEYDTSSIREENGRLVLVLSAEMAEKIEEALGDKAKMNNEVAPVIEYLLEQGGRAKDAKFADIRLEDGSPFMPGLLYLARQFIEPAAPAGGKRRHRKTQRRRSGGRKTRRH